MFNKKIDFVITWVDGNDEKWKTQRKNYEININKKMNTESRYRDWEILKYWFRSVEKYAPWVNRIYFITQGHLPSWLNLEHEKLIVVNHDEFIENRFLPTFNSNVIELSINNIPTLSESFVMFNDDMFLNSYVQPKDFFVDGVPRDSAVFSPIIPKSGTIDSIVLNNIEIINDRFSKNEILKKNFSKFFNILYGKHLIKNFCVLPWSRILGFYDNHIPVSYNKKIYNEVIEENNELVVKTLSNKFRTRDDINHWLIRYWQLACGYFIPRSTFFGAYYDLGIENNEAIDDIINSKHKVICLNDNDLLENYLVHKRNLINAFEEKYSEKSQYEK